MKSLAGWIQTTRTLATQQGMTILHYASGDLKSLINELDVDDLTSPDSAKIVKKLIEDNFKEYLERKLPKAIERALFRQSCQRGNGETMVQYVSGEKCPFQRLG